MPATSQTHSTTEHILCANKSTDSAETAHSGIFWGEVTSPVHHLEELYSILVILPQNTSLMPSMRVVLYACCLEC